MHKGKLDTFLVVSVFTILAFSLITQNSSSYYYFSKIKGIMLGGRSVNVELALSPSEQSQGLAGRSGLNPDEGMLFVFGSPGRYYFWMKGMTFPIDMIWIGEDMRVIYIKKNAAPEVELNTYGPEEDSAYVLEVPAGFSDANNVKEGDYATFTY